jgi:hypothetical protein
LLDENRGGNVKIVLEKPPRTMYDFNLIGYIIGKNFSDKIPVIEGLPQTTTANQLKVMGAAAASSGVVPLYHALGITPEAPDRKTAYREKKPHEEFVIGTKELSDAEDDISTYKSGDIDAVLVGCPHPTIGELIDLSGYLENRKVKDGLKFCLFASSDVLMLAKRMGIHKIFIECGIDIFEGDCILFCPAKTWGWKNVATNSAKYANLLPSDPTYFNVLFTTTKECVEIGTKKEGGLA